MNALYRHNISSAFVRSDVTGIVRKIEINFIRGDITEQFLNATRKTNLIFSFETNFISDTFVSEVVFAKFDLLRKNKYSTDNFKMLLQSKLSN